MRPIIVLPDGYNGHTLRFYATPIETWPDGTVKLQCAEPGKEHWFRWARQSDIDKARTA